MAGPESYNYPNDGGTFVWLDNLLTFWGGGAPAAAAVSLYAVPYVPVAPTEESIVFALIRGRRRAAVFVVGG